MNPTFSALRSLIRRRRTLKVLGESKSPVQYEPENVRRYDEIVHEVVKEAGWAPFHYDRNHNGLAEPWRAYFVDCQSCRRLSTKLRQFVPDLKGTSKLPALLAGCGCLVLVNWLPQQAKSDQDLEKLEHVNHEHLAATAALVQNALLLLTAAGLENYWASGGLLEKHIFDQLGISVDERIIAAVFVQYPDGIGAVNTMTGKQRSRRDPNAGWFQDVKFESVEAGT